MLQKTYLESLPRILEHLVTQGKITQSQKEQVAKASTEDKYKGKFFGEIALAEINGLMQADIDKGLNDLSKLKADAALKDFSLITSEKPLIYPSWLKPHFGNNNSVNDVSSTLNDDIAASAAANLAQLITFLSNQAYQQAGKFKSGVEAATFLTHTILDKSYPQIAITKTLIEQKINTAKDTLIEVSTICEVPKEIYNKYISNRFVEIEYGLKFITEGKYQKLIKGQEEASSFSHGAEL